MADGDEPIVGDEILYRRIPVSQRWYEPATSPHPSPRAFFPNRGDPDGICLSRAKYCSVEGAAASGKLDALYWVAILQADRIAEAGIVVIPDPAPDGTDPGHARIPALNYTQIKTPFVSEKALALSKMCLRVEGPFPGKRAPSDQP